MYILNTPDFPGRRCEPLQTVIDIQTVGIGSARDWLARLSDFWGGQAKVYTRPTVEAMKQGMRKVEEAARLIKADAIVALVIDVKPVSSKGMGMTQVLIYGTAVRFVGEGRVTTPTASNGRSSLAPSDDQYVEPQVPFPVIDMPVPALDQLRRSAPIVQ
jgi:uncharacterized protein YbjQ (UPF0145 family)